MPTAYLLGILALALGFSALMLGIVLFVIDKEEIVTAPKPMLDIEPVNFLLEFLVSWKWTRAFILILVGISAILVGIAMPFAWLFLAR